MSRLLYSLCRLDESGKQVLWYQTEGFISAFQIHFFQQIPVLIQNIQQKQICLLDIPCNEEYRMILFSFQNPDREYIFAAVLFSMDDVKQIIADGLNIYHYLLNAANNGLAESLWKKQDILLPLTGQGKSQSQELSIQTSLDELLGWQMIGDPEKGIQCVVKMLAGIPVSQWFSSFYLAVNPLEYHNEYTTIVSLRPPDGTWKYKPEDVFFHAAGERMEEEEKDAIFYQMKTLKMKNWKTQIVLLIFIFLLLLGAILLIFWWVRGENRDLQQRLNHAEQQVRMLIDENENLYKTVESLKENITQIHSSLEQQPQ